MNRQPYTATIWILGMLAVAIITYQKLQAACVGGGTYVGKDYECKLAGFWDNCDDSGGQDACGGACLASTPVGGEVWSCVLEWGDCVYCDQGPFVHVEWYTGVCKWDAYQYDCYCDIDPATLEISQIGTCTST